MKLKKLSKIIKVLKSNKFKYVELDTLVPVDFINQKSSDNFRHLMFTFTNQNTFWALRPDLTLMSLVRYVSNKTKKKEKIFYEGSVYRQKEKNTNPIIDQCGFEIIGSKNEKKDDAEVIDVAIKMINKLKIKPAKLVIGNTNIFKEFLYNIEDLNERWASRLYKNFNNKEYFNELLLRLETSNDLDEKIIKYDTKIYKKLKSLDKNLVIGRRKVKDIISRFEKKTIFDPRKPDQGKKISRLIRNFIKISNSPLKDVERKLRNFFKKNKIKINLNYIFPKNLKKIKNIKTSFEFFRTLDMYDGLIFKIERNKKIVFSGGRVKTAIMNKKIKLCGGAININNL